MTGFLRRYFVWWAPVPPLLATAWAWQLMMAPWDWIFTHGDPDFIYWFSGLRIVEGFGSDHIHHPGTLLQILAALILRIQYTLQGTEPTLHADFALHTTRYQSAYAALVMICFLLSQWFAGFRLLAQGYSTAIVWAVQLTPFLALESLRYSFKLAPEPWMVILYFLFMSAIGELARAQEKKQDVSREGARAMGLLTGLLVGLKFHTAGALVFLFLVRAPLNRWRALVWFALGFLGSTAIVWDKLPEMGSWVFGLAATRHHYGLGGLGLPTLPEVLRRWLDFWNQGTSQGMQVALFFLPPLLIRRWREREFWVVTLFILAMLVILAKPVSGKYLLELPSKSLVHSHYYIVFIPFVAFALLRLEAEWPRAPRRLIGVACAICIVAWSLNMARNTGYSRAYGARVVTETEDLLNGKYAACDYYSDSRWLKPFWFGFGLNWANPRRDTDPRYLSVFWQIYPRYRYLKSAGSIGLRGDLQFFTLLAKDQTKEPCKILLVHKSVAQPPGDWLKKFVYLEKPDRSELTIYGNQSALEIFQGQKDKRRAP